MPPSDLARSDSSRPAVLGGAALLAEGPPRWPGSDPEVAEVLRKLADDGSWGSYLGNHVPALTARLEQFLDCPNVLLCASGTAAVELALRGLGVERGAEVVLAGYEFRGNAGDVLALDAMPVLADVQPGDVCSDLNSIEQALTPETAAILVSHLHGAIVDMPALRELADRHSVPVLEDACQMPGARVCGRQAGLWGDVGVWSFGGSKLLSAGRGGLVYSHDAAVIQRIRRYTQRGNDASPLSEMQAAVLLPQLARLEERNRQRAARVADLREHFEAVAGLRLLPEPPADCEPGWYKTPMWYDATQFNDLPRDRFAVAMRAEGFALDPGFQPLHQLISRRRCRPAGTLANVEQAGDSLLVLHHPILLQPVEMLQTFVKAIERIRDWSAEIVRHFAPDE